MLNLAGSDSAANDAFSRTLQNLGFNYPVDATLQYPQTDITREVRSVIPPIVGTHCPVPFLKKIDRSF